MAFRFLHLADLHLETAFGGRREATRRRLREATREAFTRAVDLALERELHAVLVAGDLFDDPILSLRTERFLQREVARLSAAGVAFIACAGNHDPGGDPFRGAALWKAIAAFPGHHVARRGAPDVVTVRTPAGDPRGRPVANVVCAGHASATEGANLLAGYPVADAARTQPDLPVVGLLHTQVESARSAAEHARYAPSQPSDYARLGYDYFALGHVHLRQQPLADQPAYYAGNLQGRSIRETGAKGGWLVEVHPGASAEPQFVRLGPVRWIRLDVPRLDSCATEDELVERLLTLIQDAHEDGEECALRLVLHGATPLAANLRQPEKRAELEAILREESGVLEVELRTEDICAPVDTQRLRSAPTVLARALELIESARDADELVDELAPGTLAAGELDGETRRAYLRELLDGLDAELIQRSLVRDAGLRPGLSGAAYDPPDPAGARPTPQPDPALPSRPAPGSRLQDEAP